MPSHLPVDTADIWDVTVGLPEQVADASSAARGIKGLPSHDDIENVVVLGMGGSGIAGDILLAAAAPLMPVPVSVVKSYELPAFVGEGTLVFAISFSGNTEETLETVSDAAMEGAKVVAITGGIVGLGLLLHIVLTLFNLFGWNNLGGIGSSQIGSAIAPNFGQIPSAQPRQQGAVAIRYVF